MQALSQVLVWLAYWAAVIVLLRRSTRKLVQPPAANPDHGALAA